MPMTPFDKDRLPPLFLDGRFGAMTVTQLLGAFNDNLFKQLVCLYCLDKGGTAGEGFQSLALFLFSITFVLGSGFSGFLADRYSKRSLIIGCKVAEIAVMLAAVAAFGSGIFIAPLLVLFLMGLQSTVFGPSKYGILPEILRARDLPSANGIIQMTTFVAVIFGIATAGILMERISMQLICACCVGISVAGAITSVWVRRSPVAVPDLKFAPSMLFAFDRPTRRLLAGDVTLVRVLLISSLFWFVAGVVHQVVNVFGEQQWKIGPAATSGLMACMGGGVALGCVSACLLSGRRINFSLVTRGAWGMTACLVALSLVGQRDPGESPGTLGIRGLLIVLGFCAGVFVVPLQVFLQVRPPEDQKGRMMGMMNLVNFCGLMLSAGAFLAFHSLLEWMELKASWSFAVLALFVLPVGLLFRPPEQKL